MESAIQFLVMSKCHDEAYQLASSHRHMKTYANLLGLFSLSCCPELSSDVVCIRGGSDFG